jgi:NAD-specific glutamate dehydrogenase.
MNGRLICVVIVDDSSIFAFSAPRRGAGAPSCPAQVDALVLLELAAIQSTTALSKLSPPRWLSPAVDLTSKTPSPSSSTDTSNVPPPRSKTRIVWSEPSLSSRSERGRGRLVDDAEDVEAGDLAGVLRRLALRVVEVRGTVIDAS